MGNLEGENFCNCDNNDSKFETSFKTNQNSDKLLCPFINTIIYQNYNIESGKKNKNNNLKKKKELNLTKNKSFFDVNNCEMNFEYHTDKPNLSQDPNASKSKLQNKGIFNLNPNNNIENDKNSFNNFEINNNYNFNENNNNNNYNYNNNTNNNENNYNNDNGNDNINYNDNDNNNNNNDQYNDNNNQNNIIIEKENENEDRKENVDNRMKMKMK